MHVWNRSVICKRTYNLCLIRQFRWKILTKLKQKNCNIFYCSSPEQRRLALGLRRLSLQSHQMTAEKQMRRQRKRRQWSWWWLWMFSISASPTASSSGRIGTERSVRQCSGRTCNTNQTLLALDRWYELTQGSATFSDHVPLQYFDIDEQIPLKVLMIKMLRKITKICLPIRTSRLENDICWYLCK